MNTNRIRTSSVLLLWTILLITAHTPVQSQHGGISGKAGSYLSSFPQGLMVGPYIPATPMGAFEGTVLGGTPVNDLCDNAVVENLAAGGSVVRTGDNTGATDNLDLGVGQVWEAFTITECLDVSISYCGTTPAFQGALTFLVLGCPLDNLARTPDAQVDQTACVDGNYTIRFPQLPAGTYYYPVLSAPNAIGPYTLTISGQPCAAVPPANDDCTGAIALTPASVCISITGDVNGANAGVSLPAVTCEGFNGSAMDDVWFSFVATAETHTITVQGSDQFDTTVDLRSGACGTTTNIACADITGRGGQEVLPAAGLTVGETYYVRVNDWYGGLPITTTFTICVTGPDLGDCLADAGTIASAGGQVCFVEGSASLQATAAGNAVVPSGYSTIYVLTEGPGLVISNTATEPSFTVNAEGNFTIHTLVYDPNTLDLGIVVPGVTTGFDVNALLIQGGGTICGSLDVTGAPFTVAECTTICDADAGSLAPLDADVCLVENSAVVVANIVVEAVVPTGYDLLYVLTQGQDLVIINAGSLPFFTVDATGTYTIHTLVYDGLTLDLSNVQLGITTAAEVNALLIQGGGTVCASLDVTGAAFTVSDCSTLCIADAGTLTAETTTYCLVDGQVVVLASANGDAVVPTGFQMAYALTEGPGLVIRVISNDPVFTVSQPGSYTIHTLVYDPATVDPGAVEIDVTTGFDLNALLIQGGGTICGALDVTGAQITVLDCSPVNDDCSNAIALNVNQTGNCLPVAGDNTYAADNDDLPGCDNTNVGFADVWYSFLAGENTSVELVLDPGNMTDWGITVNSDCGGTELLCAVRPDGPLSLATEPGNTYWVRVWTNLQSGAGGAFTLCVTGSAPTVQCDGGSVTTSTGSSSESVCQDALSDVLSFTATTSSSEAYTFIVTDEAGAILTPLANDALDFNGVPLGTYRVWGISHNGNLVGVSSGADLAAVTSAGECLELSSNFVTVSVELCTGMNEATTADWMLFPNPGNGDFTLLPAYSGSNVDLDVLDQRGRIVHQERISVVKGEPIAIALGARPTPGVYTVRMSGNAHMNTLRLVVY